MSSNGNPGGYRPDDPRYGLSGQALKDYYLSLPAQFYVRSLYKPDVLHLREGAMATHLAHVRSYAEHIQFAGPLLADDGTTPMGTMAIINLTDRSAAEAYAAGDGFAKAGMFEPPRIIRFMSSKRLTQADREPDPQLQMFVCECIDGPMPQPCARKARPLTTPIRVQSSTNTSPTVHCAAMTVSTFWAACLSLKSRTAPPPKNLSPANP